MDGSVTVESELGKGTKFTVTIPHKIAPPEYYAKKHQTKPMKKWNFPEISTGMAFQFVASRQECRRPHVLQQETKRSIEATSECCLSAISGYLRYGCL